MLHDRHAAIHFGCKCTGRLCQNCVDNGKLVECPLCRHRGPPQRDAAWDSQARQSTPEVRCLGCSVVKSSFDIVEHEQNCVQFMREVEKDLKQDHQAFRNEITRTQQTNSILRDRIDVQSEVIDDLRDDQEILRILLSGYRSETTNYSREARAVRTVLDTVIPCFEKFTAKFARATVHLQSLQKHMLECEKAHETMQRKRRRLFTHVPGTIERPGAQGIQSGDVDEDEEESSSSEEEEEEEVSPAEGSLASTHRPQQQTAMPPLPLPLTTTTTTTTFGVAQTD